MKQSTSDLINISINRNFVRIVISVKGLLLIKITGLDLFQEAAILYFVLPYNQTKTCREDGLFPFTHRDLAPDMILLCLVYKKVTV